MTGEDVRFVDTTLRDGHASLWAERMPTSMMLAVAEPMDSVGYVALEVIATSHFKKCVRELREDPFERLDLLHARLRRTPMAAMCGSQPPSTFGFAPQSVIRLFLERMAAHGIRRMHMMEASNDMARMEPTLKLAQSIGLEVQAALVYSFSPRHTDSYYGAKARQAAQIGADRIYLKDPGGLITPERVKTLIPAILHGAGRVPVEFHSHCTTGLAPLAYLEAIRLGIGVVHTAIPPLANGASQPSLFNVAQNLEAMGKTLLADRQMAEEASRRLQRMAKSAGFPEGKPLEYDYAQYVHQVPGGVISNLRHQLTQMGAQERLSDVLDETVRVRADLGYPIMVTPFSQFVVSQATINVLLGDRYREVTDEVIHYTLGHFGEEAASGIDPQARGIILDRPRARDLEGFSPPEPSLGELRSSLGGPDLSDDELLLRYIMGGAKEVTAMRELGRVQQPAGASAIVNLIDVLGQKSHLRHVAIEKGDFRLVLGG